MKVREYRTPHSYFKLIKYDDKFILWVPRDSGVCMELSEGYYDLLNDLYIDVFYKEEEKENDQKYLPY